LNLFQFLKSKSFFIQLGIFLVGFVALIWLLLLCLGLITKHGETINVPNIKGLRIEKARQFLDDRNLDIAIMDSTFVLGKLPGTILEQDPKPYTLVKSDRKIYVSIQVTCPPEINMPNLKDNSLRQAMLILKSFGLSLGKIIYKADYASNAILEMQIKGKIINAGNKVRKGTLIDLVVANGLGAEEIPVPSLKGLTLDEAQILMSEYRLQLGLKIWDEETSDSTNAFIWRQSPNEFDEMDEHNQIRLGQTIDVWITNDDSKMTESDSIGPKKKFNSKNHVEIKSIENKTDEL
jgi:beta-lactam-binding protein with PASTA domain